MSHKIIPTKSLVVDASVARAAGGHQTVAPRGRRCRDFLMKVRSVGHRMAWGPKIEEEWNKHASCFASQWLTSMNNLRKLQRVDDTPSAECLAEIQAVVADESVRVTLCKDARLIVAAEATDQRVVSSDDKVRGHFAQLLRSCPRRGLICWVNPAVDDERPIAWLEAGAPSEARRQLRNYRK
jgi:hypothetical protein